MASNRQPAYNPRRAQRRALAALGLVEKRPTAGHNVSHAMNKTKRVFKPNLQRTKITVGGKTISVRLDARTIRTLTKPIKVRPNRAKGKTAAAKAPARLAAKPAAQKPAAKPAKTAAKKPATRKVPKAAQSRESSK
jgi:ribosomal protein L28